MPSSLSSLVKVLVSCEPSSDNFEPNKRPNLSARTKNCLFIAAPPVFVVKPADKRLVKGSSVKLDCLAAGNPLPTLFWMKVIYFKFNSIN